MCYIFDTLHKGMDLNIQSVHLLKSAIFTITAAIGCLCIREFLPNSTNSINWYTGLVHTLLDLQVLLSNLLTSILVDGASTHPCRLTSVVVITHNSI
jgi:hypothetical protein